MIGRVGLWAVFGISIVAGGAFAQGGRDTAPDEGSAAPDFELSVLGSEKSVRLSEAAREKPVVLIFGSYT